jgi:hypothetical protein
MLFFALMLAAAVASPTPGPVPTLSPNQLLARIRDQFRSHRPPPPFEAYTIERRQQRSDTTPDPSSSYVYHVWVRNSDRAALKRQVFADDTESPPIFDRPAFNEERDPGPPTADVFEPRPAVAHPIDQAYTPEPAATSMAVIGRVRSLTERDYRVTAVAYEGPLVHLTLAPLSDPDRNRLREVYADKATYELTKLVASDRLFVTGSYTDEFSDEFTITMGTVDGVPVVTHIHGVAGFDQDGHEYEDDGKIVDITFTDISFPATLPAWYFDQWQWQDPEHAHAFPQ